MQYPIYYKRTRLSGEEFIMMTDETTAVEVWLSSVLSATISRSNNYSLRDLETYVQYGKEIERGEFLGALIMGIERVKFTVGEVRDCIETIRESLSKVG